jgi:outer membrane protein TolC
MTRHSTAGSVFLALLVTTSAGADLRLTFEDVLARVEKANDVPPSAMAAASLLESPPERFSFANVRIETAASTSHNDVFAQNGFRYDALTALLSADFPLLDGGLRENQRRVARLEAQSFHQRLRETAGHVFRETLDAVARLYTAQERLRILTAGLTRALEMRDRARQRLETQEISNVTAAQWEDEAIVAESQLLDLELQRLEAETHVRQLMADTSGEPIEILIRLEPQPQSREPDLTASGEPLVFADDGVARVMLRHEQTQLRLQEAESARRPQLVMSAFGGVASLGDIGGRTTTDSYGLLGVRFTLSLPMFDAAAARRVAEARLQSEQAALERRTTTEQIRRQTSTLWLSIAALEKRIALVQQSVEIARRREESVTRLVAAGVRPENEVAAAAADRARRESDLLGARVELWKYQRILERRIDRTTR